MKKISKDLFDLQISDKKKKEAKDQVSGNILT
jgi:hypothetical protein